MMMRTNMKTFAQFLGLREEDGAQMQAVSPPSDMPMAKAQNADSKPVVPGDGHHDKHMEKLKNLLNHYLNEKLLPAVKSKKISAQDAIQLVQTELASFSNMIGMDMSSVQAGKTTMTTNSEPWSPAPNQVTANG